MTPTLADKLHIHADMNVLEYQLRVRTPFSNSWQTYIQSSYRINKAIDHIVTEGTFQVRYDLNKFNPANINSKIPQYSEIEFVITTKGTDGTDFGMVSKRYFWGFVFRIEAERDHAILKCYCPLYSLGRTYFDYGTMAADVHKVAPQETIPTPPTRVPDKGIFMIKVTENSEERWVIPHYLVADIPEYHHAYVNDSNADITYTGTQSGKAYKAGVNRRQWRVLGRVWDTGMDLNAGLNDFNQKISYNTAGSDYSRGNAIPSEYYQIGTDLGNYLEFINYTPVGDIYVEFVEALIEGTNDIEHIFFRAINPRITGRASAGSGAGLLIANDSRFVRDGILAGGRIKRASDPDSSSDAILSLDSTTPQTKMLTTGIAWADGDDFIIFDASEKTPRWREGIHFDSESTDYDVRTIWPSLATVNSIEWNASDGTALKLLETIMNQNAPPNYKLWCDPMVKMIRMQYSEQTPWLTTTTYYQQGSFPYGAFSVSGALPAAYDAEDDYHQITVKTAQASPRDEDTFYTEIIIEGVNERPFNLLKGADVKIYTMPPGSATAGWNFNSGVFQDEWRLTTKMGKQPSATYAELSANNYLNLYDTSVDTIIAWWSVNPVEDEKEIYAPYLVIDLGRQMEIGHMRLYTMDSKQSFEWGIKIEACDENGVTSTGGQFHYDPSASWQLMHHDFFNQRIPPNKEIRIDGPWLKSATRYILISMTWAKITDRKYYNQGLADILIFARDIVTGSARITDLGGLITKGVLTDVAIDTLEDTTKDFTALGVLVGDEVFNTTRGFSTRAVAVGTTTIDVDNVGMIWRIGDTYTIREWAKRSGLWTYYPGTGLDDSLFTLNMPLLYQQLISGNYDDWLGSRPDWRVNHRTAYYSDHSIAHSENCALRAAETAIETVRNFTVSNVVARWHGQIDYLQTVQLINPHLGITVKALIENITFEDGGVTFDASTYARSAWTGETPESIPA